MSAPLPLPTPDADSEPFWAACRAGHLAAQRCPQCRRFRWPPMAYCPFCHQRGGDWTRLPGTGVVRSFVVVHRAFDPAFADKVPYVLAHVALDGADEVTIVASLAGAAPDTAGIIGQRVAVEFIDAGTMKIPQFRRA